MGADSLARSLDRRLRQQTGSALAGGAVADPAAPARVDVGRGEHAQQGRPASCAIGADTSTHASDRARPLESIMQRCGFLGLRFTHRTKLPRVETRPEKQVHAPHSLGPAGTPIPPAMAVLADQSGRDFGASRDSPPMRSPRPGHGCIPARHASEQPQRFSSTGSHRGRWRSRSVSHVAVSTPGQGSISSVVSRSRIHRKGLENLSPRFRMNTSAGRFDKPTRRSHRAIRTTPKL